MTEQGHLEGSPTMTASDDLLVPVPVPDRLLILQERPQSVPAALRLPFGEAWLAGDVDSVGRRDFDMVVVEPAGDPGGWLARTLPGASGLLRDGGCALVVPALPNSAGVADHRWLGSLPVGVTWSGWSLVGGRPALHLLAAADRPYAERDSSLVTSALTAAWLTAGAAFQQGERERRRELASVEARFAEARSRIESDLRDRVEVLTAELDDLRRRHRGAQLVRTVAGRSRAGRAIRRARRWVHAAFTARSDQSLL
ncbi:hypothetical protein HDA40_005884 [Hamadaea flava]|uniref:Uncharacterized protein n=1 Tax=Hamadaea flava TaxID=1742688 RepID=A0ABV8LVL1_9ACTN|nr:hypothetical protein [Hamadaea flava]MCP2327377.1 hypothetical protein [Hamadaea flava]